MEPKWEGDVKFVVVCVLVCLTVVLQVSPVSVFRMLHFSSDPDAKKFIFKYFLMKFKSFKIVKILMIKIKYLARKVLYYNFIFQLLFQSAQHSYEKREGSGSDPDPYLWVVTNGSGCGSGRPKNIQFLRIRIRNTYLCTQQSIVENGKYRYLEQRWPVPISYSSIFFGIGC